MERSGEDKDFGSSSSSSDNDDAVEELIKNKSLRA